MTRLYESSDKAIDAWTGGDRAICFEAYGRAGLTDAYCLQFRGHDGGCGVGGESDSVSSQPVRAEGRGSNA